MKRRRDLGTLADPGASSSVVVYDTHDAQGNKKLDANDFDRVRVALYTDVADAVIRVQWAENGSGTLRTALSYTVAAATYTQRDILLQPGRTKISLVTTTDPSTWQAAAELVDGHALGQ